MDEQKLNLLIKRKDFLDKRISFYLKNRLLFKQRIVVGEVIKKTRIFTDKIEGILNE